MLIKPFGKNLLVEPVEVKSPILGDKSLCEYGKVIAIGTTTTEIKVGDVIGYTVFGVNKLEIGTEKYYLIPETDEFILAIIEDEKLA